jgi:hypothetical protein
MGFNDRFGEIRDGAKCRLPQVRSSILNFCTCTCYEGKSPERQQNCHRILRILQSVANVLLKEVAAQRRGAPPNSAMGRLQQGRGATLESTPDPKQSLGNYAAKGHVYEDSTFNDDFGFIDLLQTDFFPRYAPLDRGHRRIGRLMADTIHPMIAPGYNYPWRGTMWTLGDSG